MTDLKGRLTEAVVAAFAAEGLPTERASVSVSDRPDLADFQSNGALAVAKAMRANPREVALRIAARLTDHLDLASVEVAGPGFVNMRVADHLLSERATAAEASAMAGAAPVGEPRRVLVDFGGPNVAKPMHVGHLRASIIGESIKRIFRFRGDEVLGDAHFGDWGFQMGLLITALGEQDPVSPFLAAGAEPFPTDSPVTLKTWSGCIPSPRPVRRLSPSSGSGRVAPPPSCRPAGPATARSGRTSWR